MKLYRIIFPDGRFYIGCTSKSIEERIKAHLNNNSEGQYKREVFNSYNLSVSEIAELTIVLYEGWDAEFHESCLIYAHRSDNNMINRRVSNTMPLYGDWVNSFNGQNRLKEFYEKSIREGAQSWIDSQNLSDLLTLSIKEVIRLAFCAGCENKIKIKEQR